jgi:hypothetical protein
VISSAFDVLSNRGFITRKAFPGNANAAASNIFERAQEKFARGQAVHGAVFFSALEIKNGTFPVYFSAVYPTGLDLPTPATGEIVLKVLRFSGVYAEWDGDPKHPIIVRTN